MQIPKVGKSHWVHALLKILGSHLKSYKEMSEYSCVGGNC